ncbi:MAG TPA: helix-turn-helix transcriptional regulator [Paludibacter sp.]|nr:helix-turn-helix transcriptional regulator [Paludibacter sp.]
MEKNLKSLRLKIDYYCESNDLSQTAFAKKLGLSRQALGNMLSGRQKFTENFFLGIIENTDINLYELFDKDRKNVQIVSEPSHDYNSAKEKDYKKALLDIKAILEKTQI